ncbi:serine O-acetyltransferase [Fulvivirga sp. M361]|uniref:serine O-acetyltransferase n=1 Tax=Fulvivirga sp. M361 TaxID=2594266 RepID=UPI001179FB93|nr:serine O-acetyltransferase [Fulvivirga sp. M361]TRX61407.1 serine O-acetyltransferase [Fulvivirga sp. M361]
MSSIWGKIKTEVTDVSDFIGQKLAKEFISNSSSLEDALIKLLAGKLSDDQFEAHELIPSLRTAFYKNKTLSKIIEQDLVAYFERDFACKYYVEVLFFFTGFQALEAFRIAHELWSEKSDFTARWIHKRVSEVYSVDIHPAADIGSGLVIDHGIGVVIGETCKIGNNVFIFHNVTLGGTGRSDGARHPEIGSNVVIGTGATILGNIKIGENSVIAAGAVVLNDVPENTTVAGVPAKHIGKANKIQ